MREPTVASRKPLSVRCRPLPPWRAWRAGRGAWWRSVMTGEPPCVRSTRYMGSRARIRTAEIGGWLCRAQPSRETAEALESRGRRSALGTCLPDQPLFRPTRCPEKTLKEQEGRHIESVSPAAHRRREHELGGVGSRRGLLELASDSRLLAFGTRPRQQPKVLDGAHGLEQIAESSGILRASRE